MQQRKTTVSRAESFKLPQNGSLRHTTVQAARTYCLKLSVKKTALSKWLLRLPTDKIDTPDSTAINLLS